MTSKLSVRLLAISAPILGFTDFATADGIGIDKVYHPYVQLLEQEVEYRALYLDDHGKPEHGYLRHKLGFGSALTEKLFGEIYLTAEDSQGESLELESYELELKWQLTEQGEFNNDWGLLFELEKEHDESIWEASTTLIALHEWAQWIATGNLSLIYEWGDDIDDEWETAFAGQLRYRHGESLEPALEVYLSDETQGVGPVLGGLFRVGQGKKLIWELGVIFGTGKETADTNLKFNLEFEF